MKTVATRAATAAHRPTSQAATPAPAQAVPKPNAPPPEYAPLTPRELVEVAQKYRKLSPEQVARANAEYAKRREEAAAAKAAPPEFGDVLVALGMLSEKSLKRLELLARQAHAPDLPGFDLIEPLGGGGMGVVYKAKQRGLGRIVALKVLAPEYLRHEEYLARFMREARAAGRLDHPNIVRAFDVSAGEPALGQPPFLVMEYVEGETLHEILKRRTTLPEKNTCQIGRAIADALDHAHRVGLVHRDVKPDNVMVTQQGFIKLCDLGLAKSVGQDQTITRPGMTHGTPHFMSPEQSQGHSDLDIRSDLYSLGCLMFRLVAGRPPFNGDSALQILIAHIQDKPPSVKAIRPELSIGFERVIFKLLEKDLAKRYQYPAHVRQDLELLLAGKAPRIEYGIPYRAPVISTELREDSGGDAPGAAGLELAAPRDTEAQARSFDVGRVGTDLRGTTTGIRSIDPAELRARKLIPIVGALLLVLLGAIMIVLATRGSGQTNNGTTGGTDNSHNVDPTDNTDMNSPAWRRARSREAAANAAAANNAQDEAAERARNAWLAEVENVGS